MTPGALDPPLLRGGRRYERLMEGRADSALGEGFVHTVRISDPERALEIRVVALPSPSYEVREAVCHVVSGEVAPAVRAGFVGLAGLRMVAGFTRRVAEAVGQGAGADLATDAAIEVARLARQVAKLPAERAARAAGGDPWECWQLDMAGWVDLPNSCFTYSDAGRARFGTRPVTTPIRPDLYSPAPGQPRVFERRKVVQMSREAGRLHLFHSMHDDIHGFEIRYEVDCATGVVVAADAVTPRLPYAGICSEPQSRIRSVVGERLDAGLPKRLQTLLGGPAGCGQLYDLTADLLKLLRVQ